MELDELRVLSNPNHSRILRFFWAETTPISETVESTVMIITSVNSLFLLSSLKLEATWARGAVLHLRGAYYEAALSLP